MEPILPRPDPADAAAVWFVPPGERARPGLRCLVLTVLLLVPMTLTATLGSISFSSPDGTAIVSFWPAAAFQIVFSIWFGVYGALAGVIGPMLGNSLVGGSPFLFIPANAIQCCLAGLWFRYRKLDPRLRSLRDWFGLIVVGCLAANALGAVAGVAESYLRDLASDAPAMGAGFWAGKLLTWFGGNSVPAVFLAPALLKGVSPMIVRDPAFCQRFWCGRRMPPRHRRWSGFSDMPMGAKLTILALVTGIVPLILVAAWSVWSTVEAAENLAEATNQRAAQQARNESERHELLLKLWAAELDRSGGSEEDRARLLQEWRAVPEAFKRLEVVPRAVMEAEMPPEMREAFKDYPVAFYEVPAVGPRSGGELRVAAGLASAPDEVLTGLVVWREDVHLAEEWSTIEALLVLDMQGNELYRMAPPELNGWRPPTPPPESDAYTVRHEGRTWHVAEAAFARPGRRFVTLTSVRTGLAFSLARIPNPVAVLVNLAIFGSIIAGSVVAGRISGRVLAIAEAVREKGAEPGKLQLPVQGQDELGYLAQTLNRMSTELAASIRQLQVTTAEKERLAAEIELARQMQRNVLPADPLRIAGYESAAASHPAREVGGDFFDYFVRDDGTVVTMVGDAAGKGLKAAMFITETHALAHAAALHLQSPGPVLEAVNSSMVSSRKPSEDFATMLCAVLEPEQHRLLYASAGHQPPLLLRDGATQGLDLGGLPLAILPEASYSVHEVELTPGDVIVLYTDGVTDAADTGGDLFGTERLETVVRGGVGLSADELLEAILEAVREFAAGAPQSDDITVLVLRRCE